MAWVIDGQPYTHRKLINLPTPSADLYNYPYPIVINGDVQIGAVCNSDLSDLRFTNSNGWTVLNSETHYGGIRGGVSADGFFFVNVPWISSVYPPLNKIWCYFGSSGQGARSTTQQQATWDSDYCAVWHLTSGIPLSGSYNLSLIDSTINEQNLTNVNGISANTTNRLGIGLGGALFNGSNYLYIPNASGSLLSPIFGLTIEAWIYSTTNSEANIVSFSSSNQNYGYQLQRSLSGGFPAILLAQGPGAPPAYLEATSNFSVSAISYMVGTFELANGIMSIYINAVEQYGSSQYQGSANVATEIANLFLGNGYNGILSNGDTLYEIRISSTTKSNAYITYTYNNLLSSSGGVTWSSQQIWNNNSGMLL